MFEELYGKASDVVFHEIAPYALERQRFLQHCREQGFAKVCLKRVAGTVLTAAIDLHAHGGLDADRARLEDAATRIEKVRSAAGFNRDPRKYQREFLRTTTRWLLFTGHLHEEVPRPRPYAALLDDFAQWMSGERGLSPTTLRHRRWHLEKFLGWLHERERRVADLDLRDLDAYIEHLHARRYSRVTIKIHTNAIRSFVRHAELRNWCAAGIADALPGPRIYREHGLPLGPSWDEVSRLIEDTASDDHADIRDRAILLLFAVYGLRAGEVAALRLEDVDWEHDRVTVRRPKQRRRQAYPLVPIAGQAIARYLKEARPRCASRELFLKVLAPIGPMTSSSLYTMVAARMKRLGIQAPHRGPHVLRHACAGHLLERGLSLKEVGDHLGHRSLDSTRIYAKVDLQGLREVGAFDLGGLA
jgi:site-specific recombinase XerD